MVFQEFRKTNLLSTLLQTDLATCNCAEQWPPDYKCREKTYGIARIYNAFNPL
jgi:hypothetical protein